MLFQKIILLILIFLLERGMVSQLYSLFLFSFFSFAALTIGILFFQNSSDLPREKIVLKMASDKIIDSVDTLSFWVLLCETMQKFLGFMYILACLENSVT